MNYHRERFKKLTFRALALRSDEEIAYYLLLDKNHFQIVELGIPRAVTSSVHCEKSLILFRNAKRKSLRIKDGQAVRTNKPPTVQDQNVSYDVTKILPF